jgi:hypothetical protein
MKEQRDHWQERAEKAEKLNRKLVSELDNQRVRALRVRNGELNDRATRAEALAARFLEGDRDEAYEVLTALAEQTDFGQAFQDALLSQRAIDVEDVYLSYGVDMVYESDIPHSGVYSC